MKRRSTALLLAALATFGAINACSSDDEEPIPRSADSGFALTTDGFAFENFAAGYDDSVMTAALVARMFGRENVCVGSGGDTCELTPGAKSWMNRQNGMMGGGRCEGFAVLSSLFFTSTLRPDAFGAPTTQGLKLDGNVPLQEELAYWFATQSSPVTADSTQKLGPKDALRFLASFLKKDRTGEYYRIGMVRKTSKRVTGGHSVTPIRYEESETSPGVYYVHVYDNNFPGADRILTVDTNKNRWEYKASANPDEPSALYYGDDRNKNLLYFAPVKNREGVLACPFCKGAPGGKKIVTVSGADVVANAEGGATGVKGGEISEGKGASVQPSFSASTWANPAPFTYFLPEGDATFDVTASIVSTQGQGQISASGAGYSVEVKNLTPSAGSPDTLKVASGGRAVEYKNTSGTAVSLSAAVQAANGNVVQLQIEAPAGATNVTTDVNPETGEVKASADNTQGKELTVTVTAVDAATGKTMTGTVTTQGSETGSLTASANTLIATGSLEVKQDLGKGEPPVIVSDGCADKKKNGAETDIDCGGTCPNKCALGNACLVPDDCSSIACHENTKVCVASACENGTKDGKESDVDCGGTCTMSLCAVGRICSAGSDCASNACSLSTSKCVASQCLDGVKNGLESDIDCGGGTCGACAVTQTCAAPSDCASASCGAGSTCCPANCAACTAADACTACAAGSYVNPVSSACEKIPTGGTITNIAGFNVHTFTSSGAFVTFAPTGVEYLVVAGGGGGGSGDGAGGGAGGLLTGNLSLATNSYPIVVGAGGAGAGVGEIGTDSQNGLLSRFATFTALGGGRGGQEDNIGGFGPNNRGGVGGSGGGFGGANAPLALIEPGAVGTAGQGFGGGTRTAAGIGMGGGGGAGGVGADGTATAGGNGGIGLSSSITGAALFYAGGGGGSGRGAAGGTGGTGGGGAGGNSANGTPGTVNTGGGGGGGGDQARSGGAGGSGIVILRYPVAP